MGVLGMNYRNALIKRVNPVEGLWLAKDKLGFKEVCLREGIPVPKTVMVLRSVVDVFRVGAFPERFVLKPDHGFGGRGVLVLRRERDGFVSPTGRMYYLRDVKRHVEMIIDGQFSGLSSNDVVLVEELVGCSPALRFRDGVGLPDIRVLVYNRRPVMAMVRYPTRESDGKANLAAGALGLGVDLGSGALTGAWSEVDRREYSLRELGVPDGFVLPRWGEVLSVAVRAAGASGLVFSGVDVVLDDLDRVLVLEINGFPGLEIQNVNRLSLRDVCGL